MSQRVRYLHRGADTTSKDLSTKRARYHEVDVFRASQSVSLDIAFPIRPTKLSYVVSGFVRHSLQQISRTPSFILNLGNPLTTTFHVSHVRCPPIARSGPARSALIP